MGTLTAKNNWFSAGAIAAAKQESYDAITREFSQFLYSDSQWQYYARGAAGDDGSNLLKRRVFKNGYAYAEETDLNSGEKTLLPVRVVAYSEGGGLNGSDRIWVWEGNNALSAAHFDRVEWKMEDKGVFQAVSLAIVGGAAAWSASLAPSPLLSAGEQTAVASGLDAVDLAAVEAVQGGQAGGVLSAVEVAAPGASFTWGDIVGYASTAGSVAKTVATGVAGVAGAITAVNKATEKAANAQNPGNAGSYIAQANGGTMNLNTLLIAGGALLLIIILKG